jgi:hypothetical protein
MEVSGKTRRDPTEKKQEVRQGGGSHSYKREGRILSRFVVATVVGGRMNLTDAVRRMPTGGSVVKGEAGPVVGKTKTVVAGWML